MIVHAIPPHYSMQDGVDDTLLVAAGPELMEYCTRRGWPKLGETAITPGFKVGIPSLVSPLNHERLAEMGERSVGTCKNSAHYCTRLTASKLLSIHFDSL